MRAHTRAGFPSLKEVPFTYRQPDCLMIFLQMQKIIKHFNPTKPDAKNATSCHA
jgi:hypothetical protein